VAIAPRQLAQGPPLGSDVNACMFLRVRELAQLRTVGWAYNQRGVVATVRTLEPNETAWQRFLSTGPLAVLPVRGGFSNIVWSTTNKQVECGSRGNNHL
jgi:2-polyprenyl-6-methoxyphenol hydroxylase-like FAD-dependent oxidoreductase